MTAADHEITGTLTKFEGWESGPLAGEGYFLALKFSDLDESATGAKVGLVPSKTGMGLQELDSDMDAVFKIDNKNVQELVIEVHDDDGNITIEKYGLSGLTLTDIGA